jgi:galactofuranose transport system permease protein
MKLTRYLPLISTAVIAAALLFAGSRRYDNFLSPAVFSNILSDNAYLGVIAVGLTFVILAGGIDLSVGSVMALATVLIAKLIQDHHIHPVPAIIAGLALGALLGCAMGCLIHFFQLAPFLVTLAGLFFARGLAFVVSLESISIDHPLYSRLSAIALPLGPVELPLTAIAFLAVVVIAIYIAHFTRFGRNVYALGGSESSAALMGLPVARTKILVYTLSGLCAALGGVVHTLYIPSGNATAGSGLELDAIAVVVIGGTLLTGGIGYVAGTLLGILIFGTIQMAITFENLNSWWTRIAIGLLLFVFIVLQRLLTPRKRIA